MYSLHCFVSQAKKFVESTPIVVKTDIPKDEAEKLKAAIDAAGGVSEVEWKDTPPLISLF